MVPQLPRTRNPRGAGWALRRDIVEAAGGILDETGRDDAVSLRAVARRIGIAAPSIYAHFADRDAMLTALVDDGFVELGAFVRAARHGVQDSAQRLHAGCRAYLEFATRRPQRYQLMFSIQGHRLDPETYSTSPGAESFAILVDAIADCAADQSSTSIDPFADAVAVLVALHGYALLRPARPNFPWPDEAVLLNHLVGSLARLRPVR